MLTTLKVCSRFLKCIIWCTPSGGGQGQRASTTTHTHARTHAHTLTRVCSFAKAVLIRSCVYYSYVLESSYHNQKPERWGLGLLGRRWRERTAPESDARLTQWHVRWRVRVLLFWPRVGRHHPEPHRIPATRPAPKLLPRWITESRLTLRCLEADGPTQRAAREGGWLKFNSA